MTKTKKNKSSKDYHYCLTLGQDKKTFEEVMEIQKDCDNCRYLICGKEVADSGWEHWQIYVQFARQIRRLGIKKLFGKSVHIEIQQGTNEQARNYCWKGAFIKEPTEHPQPSAIFLDAGSFVLGAGTRSDLERIKDDMDGGMSHWDICQTTRSGFSGYARYHSFFYKYKRMKDDITYSRILREPLEVIVIYGEAGTGKSTSILVKEGLKNCYILRNPNNDNKFWNGYEGQKVLVIDDFYGWIKLNDILNILDNKPYRCRMLCDSVWARWEKVYITSNVGPEEWYKIDEFDENSENKAEIVKAFLSRLSKCLKVTKGNTGALVKEWMVLPHRGRHIQKEYLVL